MADPDDLWPDYDFDYSKSKPNRFAEKYNRTRRAVVLDADIADKFPSAESVNEALRFLVRITNEHRTELNSK
jgi:hypothetical protein